MASGPFAGDNSREHRSWDESKRFYGRNHNNNNGLVATASEDDYSPKQMVSSSRFETDDSFSHNRPLAEPVNGREAGSSVKFASWVRISLNSRSKVDIKELRRRLMSELDQVRSLVKRIESREYGISGSSVAGRYGHLQYSANDAAENVGRAMRVNSEVGSAGKHDSRSFRGLGASVAGNSHHGAGEIGEKERRMLKSNQYHLNSSFPSGKEKSNKKVKTNGGKGDGGEMGGGFRMDKSSSQSFRSSSPLFRSCSNLLAKLMKHKHGWVFNKPVDVKGLGLHDYYTIVKHPMDLGTVKSQLNKNWYKSAEEFAEDVRLTFRNAMLYNPKGQDVHIMADILLKLFEENWAAVEAEYKLNRMSGRGRDAVLPAKPSRKAQAPVRNFPPANAAALLPPQTPVALPPAPEMRTLDRAESITKPTESSKSKPASFGHSGRMPVPKKPKARDPDKRDMTLEEKQKLSINLQNLPSEKLGAIVEIIKKRNTSLCQQDDEIEVDIDAVDPETLWELDRFVTNYKKGLSKNKRKAELALQTGEETGHTIQETNLAPVTAQSPKQTEIVEKNVGSSSPIQVEKAPSSPVQIEKALSSPIQVENASPSPVQAEKALSSPIQVENASPSPVQAEKELSSPIQVENASPSPVQAEKELSSPIQVENASPSPVQAENASPSPVQVENASPSPVQVEKASSSRVQIENQGDNVSGSSSSSSSSSDTGSSSSDSDSDSSSASGSDAGH